MQEVKYLDIEKNLIPYKFSVVINNTIVKFLIRYNSVGEYFTADIYDKDDDIIAYAKKFILEVNLFDSINDDRLPAVEIIPFDPTDEYKKITYDNFMNAIKPYIFEVEE